MKLFKVEDYFVKQLTVALCVNIGFILGGYTIGWIAVAVPKLQDPIHTPLPSPISLSEASWIGTCHIIGAIIGPFTLVQVSNKFGRKLCFIIGCLLVLTGSILSIFVRTFESIVVGRFIWGYGSGTIVITGLIYIGEMSSPDIRGAMLSLSGVFQSLGGLLAYSTGPFVSYSGTGFIYIATGCCFLFALIYVPESPLFLILKGNQKAALETLRVLRRINDVETEDKYVTENVINIHHETGHWREMFTIKNNRKTLTITLILFVLQESSGMLAFGSFVTIIFQKAGSFVDPNLATIIVGVTQVVTTLAAPVSVEKFGRRMSLLMSSAFCCVFMTLLGTYFYLDYVKHPIIHSLTWLPLLLMILLYCAFNGGLNIVPNTLVGELYRPNVRSIGTSISMTFGWAFGALSILSFGYVVEAVGTFVIFWIYASVNLLAFIFSLFVVPETKGLSLSGIQKIL